MSGSVNHKKMILHQRSPVYQKLIPLQNQVISIEGLIGVGKSTLGKALERFLTDCGFKARYFAEKINMTFLKVYLKDMYKYAFSFQMTVLQDRIAVHKEAEAFARDGGIAIIDRGIPGDIAFAIMQCNDGFFTAEEWAIYEEQIAMSQCYEASVVLHLDCSPATSMDRVKVRDRDGESAYTEEYMAHLAKATTQALQRYHHGPILTMDWKEDLSVSGHHVLEITDAKCEEVLLLIVATYMAWCFNAITNEEEIKN